MGQATSLVRGCSVDVARVFSMTWPEFVDMTCALNVMCREFVDENGRYLLFAIKKGTAESYLWKATIRICVLRRNAIGETESCRVITLAQFLTLQKLLAVLLDDFTPARPTTEICTSTYLDSLDARTECIVCMQRAPDTILPCAHSYCTVCIERWKEYGHSFCPLCREPLQMDGNDEWVILENPQDEGPKFLTGYLMSLAD